MTDPLPPESQPATLGPGSTTEPLAVGDHNSAVLAVLAEACRITGRMYGSESTQYQTVAAIYDAACARPRDRRIDQR